VPRHVAREIDHRVLRELQRRALHFHLDMRRPEVIRRDASGAPGRRPSLADMLRESLRSRVLTSDIDREALVDLGLHFLREAEQVSVVRDRPTAVEEP
jgi:exonuclease SbcD